MIQSIYGRHVNPTKTNKPYKSSTASLTIGNWKHNTEWKNKFLQKKIGKWNFSANRDFDAMAPNWKWVKVCLQLVTECETIMCPQILIKLDTIVLCLAV